MNLVSLGKQVRKERTRLHLTQEKLAEMVGISVSFLGHIERGSRIASVDTLVNLANVLHVGLDYLLGDSLLYGDISQNDAEHHVVMQDISRFINENWDEWLNIYKKDT